MGAGLKGKFAKVFPMSSISTQSTSAISQAFKSLTSTQNITNSAFDTLISAQELISQVSETFTSNTAAFTSEASGSKVLGYGAFSYPIVVDMTNKVVYGPFFAPYLSVQSTTTTTLESLLNADISLPTKAYDSSELGEIEPTLLQAISKDTLETTLQAQEGFKTIFFRDAQSLEFAQDTLSEASIEALKAAFGGESFLEREDGSLVLRGKAERFVSGWQKALQNAQESQSTLDTLIQRDGDFNGELSANELGSGALTATTTITQTTTVTSFSVWFFATPVIYVRGILADFEALSAGFAFVNLSPLSQNLLENAFAELFSSANDDSKGAIGENLNSDEGSNADSTKSGRVFDRAKFNEFYANFKNSFLKISADFAGIRGFETTNLNFKTLSSVVADLSENSVNLAIKRA